MNTPKRGPDYVEHGSEKHAALLGLIPDPKSPSKYRLADGTAFGPQATQAYLDEVLRQKISTLESGPPAYPQTEDPTKPSYAPPLWVPVEAPQGG